MKRIRNKKFKTYRIMADNFIISIGRKIGAGGLETAGKLAKEFGIRMFDKNLLVEVAKESGLNPEIFKNKDESASRGRLGALSSFRQFVGLGSQHSTSNNTIMSEESLFKVQSDVMRKIAGEQSCVIVGRCSDYILRDHPRLLTVFITAPIEWRIPRIMASEGLSESEAKHFIEQKEQKRAAYYNYYTFKRWGDSSGYDLCVDSAKLGGTDAVVELIKFTMKQRNLI